MSDLTTEAKKIAIQGGYGAFHEIAAINYFENENIEIIPKNTFKDLFTALKNGLVDYGITAIENSLAGSILPNYSLLLESKMRIIGEIYLRIKQNLVALPGQSLSDIKEIYSHPMAILQCQKFFEKHPTIKLIDSIDTALSAKEIHDKNLTGVGAIASSLAARKYNLDVLASSIETNKMNYTRFLILEGKNGVTANNGNINKSSITFAIAHEIGCLSKVLSILSYYNINLSKIQSMPIIGEKWEYQFYVDLELNDLKLYKQAIDAIKPFTSNLQVLGEYLKGKSIME